MTNEFTDNVTKVAEMATRRQAAFRMIQVSEAVSQVAYIASVPKPSAAHLVCWLDILEKQSRKLRAELEAQNLIPSREVIAAVTK